MTPWTTDLNGGLLRCLHLSRCSTLWHEVLAQQMVLDQCPRFGAHQKESMAVVRASQQCTLWVQGLLPQQIAQLDSAGDGDVPRAGQHWTGGGRSCRGARRSLPPLHLGNRIGRQRKNVASPLHRADHYVHPIIINTHVADLSGGAPAVESKHVLKMDTRGLVGVWPCGRTVYHDSVARKQDRHQQQTRGRPFELGDRIRLLPRGDHPHQRLAPHIPDRHRVMRPGRRSVRHQQGVNGPLAHPAHVGHRGVQGVVSAP
mmetsp:Transcript_2578/g.6028  ORF Transcript_2578/g.6028 Transcript_2578/m.6028 type:complete len:258 (+) Transcript_2578:407-1180(+)